MAASSDAAADVKWSAFQQQNEQQEIPSTKVQSRGIVAYFTTYRPPAPLEICTSAIPPVSKNDEVPVTGGETYNYNGNDITPAALKAILRRLQHKATDEDVDAGHVTGLVFVSERDTSLETLHFMLRFSNVHPPADEVYSFSEVYGTFNGVRMEDSGCFAGEYLVYVSTMEPAVHRRQPWNAVFKTNLLTGDTERLTPRETADLSPSVTPSGKKIAVASFENKPGGWVGEVEDLLTDIFVMNVDEPYDRKLLISNGGWPSWGSEEVLFFHRKVDKNWGVFRAEIKDDGSAVVTRVTPADFDAVTPAAIGTDKVAVATMRQKPNFSDPHRTVEQYRHIEIFSAAGELITKITQLTKPMADHFNPFLIEAKDGTQRIGYHRCNPTKLLKAGDIFKTWDLCCFESMVGGVSLFRAPGAFPAFFRDGSKFAFVDNEFKAVSVMDHTKGLRKVYETVGNNGVWSPVWNQNPKKNILYVCKGSSFNASAEVNIVAIAVDIAGVHHKKDLADDAPSPHHRPGVQQLTFGANNAFPSTNPEGTKMVFRSTMDDVTKKGCKNLYIMDLIDDPKVGQKAGTVTRLTHGDWVDTHAEWSPNGKWIVFSSSRDKPAGAPALSIDHDFGYFAVFILKVDDPLVVRRIVTSGYDVAGHVNHPYFCPDGRSLVFAADLAAVSADPMSMPLFLHSARPYGDIFSVDIDPEELDKNVDIQKINRLTHSRYENGTCTWAQALPEFINQWAHIVGHEDHPVHEPACPYLHPEHGGESLHMTGHLFIPKTQC